MKKIILFLILVFQVWFVSASTYNAWDYFKHSYSIINNFPCSIKITKIKKCYTSALINPAWASVFSQVQLRGWIIRVWNSDCYEYNPNYTIAWNTTDTEWDIGFWTIAPPAVIWMQVSSTFEFEFDILWTCSDAWSTTTYSVMSSVVWQYCWDWIRNLWEACDSADITNNNWWTATPWCNNLCQVVNLVAPICWNAIVEAPETCDDWNLINGDWCSNVCTIEVAPICWNAIVEAPETCDDWNLINGDWCNNLCQIEVAVCWDWVILAPETCDPWVWPAWDWSACYIPWTSNECSPLWPPACWDWVVELPETCDDWNLINGDWCSNICQIEVAVCWDWVILAPETCDPWVWPAWDWSACYIPWTSNECTPLWPPACWDWVVELPETCDDWNLINWDWCNNLCQIEVTTCNLLSASPASSNAGSLISTLSCSWDNVSTYQIDCWNGQVFNWVWTNNWTETFSHLCNYATTWVFNSVCTINWTITNPACNETVNVSQWGWWCTSNCWWSSGPSCVSLTLWNWGWTYTNPLGVTINESKSYAWSRNITYTWSVDDFSIEVICKWDWQSNWAWVDCWNWTILENSINNGSRSYTFTCAYDNSITNNSPDFRPQCYVSSNANSPKYGSLSCWWNISFWPWTCWDWILQSPNVDWILEQCDYWSANWNYVYQCDSLNLVVQCDNSCKIRPDTCPSNWAILLWPSGDKIIWDWVNPFEEINDNPYIKNNSEFDLDLNQLCLVRKTGSSLTWLPSECKNIPILAPWEQFSFTNYPIRPNVFWNIAWIVAWSYDDNVLVTTLKDSVWTILTNAYFAADYKVRVSRPSVVALWGWTSFVNNSDGIANVKKVADEWRVNVNSWKNDNFEWVWISGDLSSSSKNLSDSDSITNAQWDTNNDSYNSVITSNWLNNWIPISDITQFVNFNWIENVFILKNKDFEINNTNNNFWTWPRTYIIENGKLIIKANIIYPDNIAFVVKWWNLEIDANVTKITWTYIIIPKNLSGWYVKWIWVKTTNVLTIVWSIHWNINDLVANRTYISQDDSSWLLNVWTIVSFGSSVFRKPAPLTWQFLWEYIESQKIAK
jgi:cysteine-rich repeat protein